MVRGGRLVHADETEIAREQRAQARRWRAMSVSVSTHVLDTGSGRPAAEVIELLRGDEVLADGVTDSDGRVSGSPRTSRGARRMLRSSSTPPSPFFTRVELQVELAEGTTITSRSSSRRTDT